MVDLQFHLAENVDPDIAQALRRHGIEVTTTAELGMRGQSDVEQIEFARQRERVIVTHDADFLRIAQQSQNHSGIIYCAKNTRTIGEIIRSLILIYEVLSTEELDGKVEYI
jgi:predicted nuclease of predicted toxin-antitoxin system